MLGIGFSFMQLYFNAEFCEEKPPLGFALLKSVLHLLAALRASLYRCDGELDEVRRIYTVVVVNCSLERGLWI